MSYRQPALTTKNTATKFMQPKHILISRLLLFIKILLILSICSAIFSCLFLLLFGEHHEFSFNVQWCCMIATAFIIYFSVPVLIIVSIYCKVKKEKVWATIKKEVILLTLVILAWGLVALMNNYLLPLHR
jgi:hypothetical protein